MRVSIIVCTFNCAPTLGRALRSAINQKFPREQFEVVVVDDGSTDHTQTVLKEYEAFGVRVVRHEQNLGLPAAKNTGLKNSRGLTAMFLDADGDWLLSNCILFFYEFLMQNKEYSYVYGDYYLVDERGNQIGRSNKLEGSGVLFRKDDLEEVGLFDEEMRAFEERVMYAKLEKAGKKGLHLPVAMYKYTQRENSLSRGGLGTKDTAKEVGKLAKKLEEIKNGDG